MHSLRFLFFRYAARMAFSVSLAGSACAAADSSASLKARAREDVDAMRKQTQVMVDMLFSFAELGFQEVETARYLTGILEKEGFRIERGIAGMPTAWMATWGSGKPVIALGSDVDCIPQASQKPGVAYHDPLIEGAPGHGEGHNSGQAVNVTSAVVVKRLMEQAKLGGTIKLWPGVAEEQLAGKAHLVRAGCFQDVDAVLFTHVSSNLGVGWGLGSYLALVSVEYQFSGESAHAGGAPWRGRSALDAVELMNIGWNFRREHLRPQQRSHYVITNGGDQPNVVPPNASVWYFFREADFERVQEMRGIADSIAQGAALMTNTGATSRVLGAAWAGHFNQAIAETVYENIKAVGLPEWSEADQTLAKAVQRELQSAPSGLALKENSIRAPSSSASLSGGSDDIGDVSWTVPTVVINYPSNIPNLPGHNWSSSIAMATPIAHKGATAGAKVVAMTMVDMLTRPEIVEKAWTYFRDVQTRERKYQSFMSAQDKPAVWLNAKIMAEYRERQRKFYYDPAKYDSYLEQLGIVYPTIRTTKPSAPDAQSRKKSE